MVLLEYMPSKRGVQIVREMISNKVISQYRLAREMQNIMPPKTQSAVLAPIIPLLRYLPNWDNTCRKLFSCKDLCVYYVKSAWGVCKVSQSKAFGVFLVLGALGYYLPQDVLAYPEIDLSAIAKIESSGRPSVVNAKDNKGVGSYGLHQISPFVLTDFNKAHGTRFSRTDLLKAEVNTRMAHWYLNSEIPRLIAFYRKKNHNIQDDLLTRLSFYSMRHKSVLAGKRNHEYYEKYRRLTNAQI